MHALKKLNLYAVNSRATQIDECKCVAQNEANDESEPNWSQQTIITLLKLATCL